LTHSALITVTYTNLQLDDDNRAIVSYISGLSTDQKVDALAERMNEMTLRLDRVHSLINAAWALTAAQQVGDFSFMLLDYVYLFSYGRIF
jgi:hypothetical protein